MIKLRDYLIEQVITKGLVQISVTTDDELQNPYPHSRFYATERDRYDDYVSKAKAINTLIKAPGKPYKEFD